MSEVKVNKISPRTNCGTVTLGDSGDTIALGAGASQTGFGRTGTVDWQTTKKTTAFTAVNGEGYFVDTAASGAVTMTLPSSPSAGNIVAVKDYNGNFNTANLTIGRNGSPINGGSAADVVIDTQGASIVLVYVDATQGWVATQDDSSVFSGENFLTATGGTITTCGDCKIHTFTGPGTFTVSQVASCASSNIVSYMVVAGGGGGGGSARGFYSAGGGGAGGFRELKNPVTPYTASPLDGYPTPGNRITVTAAAFPITVGGGGGGGTGSGPGTAPGGRNNGSNGNPSVFSTITSTAGGGGSKSGGAPGAASCAGSPGGSGGGVGGYSSGSVGSGNTPPVTPAQGSNGGTGDGSSRGYGGAGGGATAVGQPSDIQPTHGALGGTGATTNITASPVARATGGPAGTPTTCAAANAGDNTGDGGPGGNNIPSGDANGGNGGSGIVVIRYKFK
jgi:hypothetical protein